jgi:hypothetical protein
MSEKTDEILEIKFCNIRAQALQHPDLLLQHHMKHLKHTYETSETLEI